MNCKRMALGATNVMLKGRSYNKDCQRHLDPGVVAQK